MLDAVRQDLRQALRVLRRSPGLAAASIAFIAAGIGANATIFTVFDALLLRPLRTFLFGISPGDPATFVGVILLLGGGAVLACAVPALRATRVDPAVALRYE